MKLSLPRLRFNSRSVVGLDVGSSAIKAVELTMKGRSGGFELSHLGVASVPAEAIVQGAFLNATAITGDAIRTERPISRAGDRVSPARMATYSNPLRAPIASFVKMLTQ